VSNQNRQIGSENALNQLKVSHLKTIYPNIIAINAKIDLQWLDENDLDKYDII
jgi:tRNA A37 threonylcarbamoyladenosine dehydratase